MVLAANPVLSGSVATLKTVTEEVLRGTGGEVSGSQIEQLVDEPILLANIIVADTTAPAVPPQNLIRAISLVV
jgi:hypothetical protein